MKHSPTCYLCYGTGRGEGGSRCPILAAEANHTRCRLCRGKGFVYLPDEDGVVTDPCPALEYEMAQAINQWRNR